MTHGETKFEHDNVVNLSANNFKEKISDGNLYFIKFYAPWCGHCKSLAPTWSSLSDAYKDNENVNIAHVDCTQHKAICSGEDVKGYPTLKLYFNGESYKKYAGKRSLDELKKFVEEAAADLFTETTA